MKVGVFFFKQKTAYEVRISDWSSDVCSSDLTVDVGLFPDLAAAANREHKLFGQCVHDRYTYAVQTAGNLVGVVIELTAGVQHGHDDLGCGNAFFLVYVYRDATTVVTTSDGQFGRASCRERVCQYV